MADHKPRREEDQEEAEDISMERQAANMKLRQYLRRAMAAALCLMLCAGLVQPALAASGKIPGFSSSRKCSLTLAYGQAMEGVTVRLYRVASVDADVRFQAEGKFQEYLEGVNLNRLTQSGWVELAKRLEGEVTRGQDKAAQTLQAGKDGTVNFQNQIGRAHV